MTRQIGKYPDFALDTHGYQCLNTMFMVNPKGDDYSIPFLLGVLNSSLIRAYWIDRFYDQRSTFPKIKGTYLERLPICNVDLDDPAEKRRHDLVVGMVEGMLRLHKELAGAKTPNEKETIQRQIAATDAQTDQLVYELYGLTNEEIRIVEEATRVS